MPLSSSCRGQVSPLSALVALFVVCAAVSGYATTIDHATPTQDRQLADATLSAVETALEDDVGVVSLPENTSNLPSCPDGYSCRVVVAVDDQRRVLGSSGPVPHRADSAETRVSVRVSLGEIRFGTLRVEVWK